MDKPGQGLKSWPVGRGIGEIGPSLAVPEENPAVRHAGVGSTAERFEGYALRALNLVQELDLRLLQQVPIIFCCRNLRPGRHLHQVSFEFREIGDRTVFERVDAAVQSQEEEEGGEKSARRHGRK